MPALVPSVLPQHSAPLPAPATPSNRALRIVDHAAYLEARRRRGELSAYLTPEVLAAWKTPVPAKRGRGAVEAYSDLAIISLLAIKAAVQRSFAFVIGRPAASRCATTSAG